MKNSLRKQDKDLEKLKENWVQIGKVHTLQQEYCQKSALYLGHIEGNVLEITVNANAVKRYYVGSFI